MNNTLKVNRLVIGCLLVCSTVAAAFALSYMRSVLIPFVLALFLTYMVTPIVNTLQTRLKMPRWLSFTVTLFGTVLILGLISLFVVMNFRDLLQSADIYKARLLQLTNALIALIGRLEIHLDSNSINNIIQELPVFTVIKTAAGGMVHLFSSTALVLIFLFFLLSGSKTSEKKSSLFTEMDIKIRRYILTKLGISAATGVLIWITFLSLGVELAFMFGLLTFLLNFIPTIGPLIAVLLPIPILLLQVNQPLVIFLAITIPSIIQFVIGNILETKLLGQSLDLHPATLLLSLMFWGMIWGPVGMLLAAPIMAILKIALGRLEATHSLSELMAGRFSSTESSESS